MTTSFHPSDPVAAPTGSPALPAGLTPELLQRIDRLTLLARHAVEGAIHGLHRSPMQGLSVEFSQHRPYAVGDELRHLDWKILGRSDRYVVKQYEQETNLRAMILLDASKSMAYPTTLTPTADSSKWAYAQTLAAAMTHLLIGQGDAVATRTTIADSDGLPPSSAPSQVHAVARHLLSVSPAGQANLHESLDRLAIGLKRRWLVILISDLFGDDTIEPAQATAQLIQAISRIRHAGHDLLIYQTLHRSEIDFDLGHAGHGVTVIKGLESGHDFIGEPLHIRQQVQQEIRRFLADWDLAAQRLGIQLHRCPTDQPVEQAIVQSLHQRAAASANRHRMRL